MSLEQSVVDRWVQLDRTWREADRLATAAEDAVRLSFERARRGTAGPSVLAVSKADELRQRANAHRLALDSDVAKVMQGRA